MRKFIPLISFLVICLCSACISGKKLKKIRDEEKQNGNKVVFDNVTVRPQRKDNFRTTPNKQLDILHADISVRFDWAMHECIGTEKIILKPYFYETDSILLDAKNMTFSKIQITDRHQNELRYLVKYDKRILNLKLEKKIKASDTLLLTISYTARPDENEKGTGKAIRDDRGLYFINTDGKEPFKPTQLWTQGETESNSNWFPTIDNPNEKFTSTLTMQVSKELTTLSNGELISSTTNESEKTDVWVNNLPMPAYLTMMAVGDFTITKDNWNQKEVSYYLEDAYRPFARRIFNNTVEMIGFYSDILGVPYPWHKYAQIVVRDYVSGAMENTSATLHGEFVQKNDRELSESKNDGIISHELFHQWFGDLVTCESWSHLVLNEGFASFGEQLWIEHKEGKDAALRKCYTTIERYLGYTKENDDAPIVNYNYRDKDDMFNTLTYQKGSRVLQMLRTELGDEAFFLGLKNYLEKHAYGSAEIDDLRAAMERVSGKDLRPFFQQWFMQGGHPVIEVHYDYNDTTRLMGIQIEQVQEEPVGLFKFPLKFKVSQGNQVKEFSFNILKKKETFFVKRFDEESPDLPRVFIDPDATFLGEIRDHKSLPDQVVTYHQATSYVEKVRSLTALSKEQKIYDTARVTILSAINDADDDIRLRALKWVDWSDPSNLSKTREVLLYLGRNDPSASVRSEVVKILGNTKDPQHLNFYIDLTSDSSYTVAGNALAAIYKILPDQAFRMCRTLERDARGYLLEQVAVTNGLAGDNTATEFFKDNLMKFFNRTRAMLIENYNVLVMRLKQDAVTSEAVMIFKQRASEDRYASVRYSALKALSDLNAKQLVWAKESTDPVNDKYKQEAEILKGEIALLIKNEKDKEVINLLKMNGLRIE